MVGRCFFKSGQPGYLDFLNQYKVRNPEIGSFVVAQMKAVKSQVGFLSLNASLCGKVVEETLHECGGEEVCSTNLAKTILQEEVSKECRNFCLLSESKSAYFSQSGRLTLDELFSSYISKIGPHGKKLSCELNEASMAWSTHFWRDRKTSRLFKLWSDSQRPPYYCRFLKLLAEVLWKDRALSQVEKGEKHVLAITQSVYRPLIRILSAKTNVHFDSRGVFLLCEGKVLGKTSFIDTKRTSLIMKGARLFSSIYHHRLLRLFCKKGFERWVQGSAEANILRFERGETEIAEELGCKFKDAPSLIKALLHAQAYMHFSFDDGSEASLIELRSYSSIGTNRCHGLEIVLCEQLMPHYTFQTTRQRRLLVPIPNFPEFVSASQFQSGQAILQMLIMEEFTSRSLELVVDGSVNISPDRWNYFFRESALPLTVFRRTLESWIGRDPEKSFFLIEVEKNRYVLGTRVHKENRFLLHQGSIRRERQRQGRMSVKKRPAPTCF